MVWSRFRTEGMDPLVTRLFPLWAVIAGTIAYTIPAPFVAARPIIVPLLGVVMFAMGMTLTPSHFTEILRRPRLIVLGITLQFLLMPLAAWLLSLVLDLAPAVAVGLVLVGSCPGGTASNVVCYLAHGDVALSITLTATSTLAAVVATPLLTWLYVGQLVPIPVFGMFATIAKVVVIPVLLGITLNTLIGERLERFKQACPILSVGAIVVIITVVVALNQGNLGELAPAVVAAVTLHNGAGLLVGYGVARQLGLEERLCRTLAIEVGMQNSGLGVALATQHLSELAGLPGAVFSVWHNLTGSFMASHWGRRGGVTRDEGLPRRARESRT